MVRLIAVIVAAAVLALAVFLALGLSDDEQAVAPEATRVPATARSRMPVSPTSQTLGPSITPAVPSGSPPPGLDALYATDANKPAFIGEIAGIHIYGLDETGDPLPCGDSVEPEYVDFSGMPFSVGYEPAGATVDMRWLERCGHDQTVYRAGVSYRGVGTGLSVQFLADTKEWRNDSMKGERVSEGEINGTPAVFSRPMSEEGYGYSTILWLTPGGLVRVYAIDVPFEIVVEVAESIDCFAC